MRTGLYSASVVVIVPSITSACPPTYFVAAMIDTSTPCSKAGKKYGVAQLLSISDCRASRVRCGGDRRNVLHLERQRTRRLGEHHPRLRAQQLGDAGTDARVVVRGGDPVPRQHRVAEMPRRAYAESTISR